MAVKVFCLGLLLAACVGAAEHEVLVSFMPHAGQGENGIDRYVVGADGVWRRVGQWRAKPATGLAAIGDGWIYTAGGKAIGRFTRAGRPDNGPFCVTPRPFTTFVGSPDNRWFVCADFNNAANSAATLQRFLISDPRAGGLLVDGLVSHPALRLETARQLAFGADGLLYVGCRGNAVGTERRSGVAALDLHGDTPREVAFYPAVGATGGFAFTPDMKRLVVHGHGVDRLFTVGETSRSVSIASGMTNAFCATRIDGVWYCGDWMNGAVKRLTADGTYEIVAMLRPGITALLCLDDVGAEVPRHEGYGVKDDGALCGPYERMRYNSAGTCDLKVGLWAFPLPMDFDGDGIDDLVVSTPDTPWGGTFLFIGTKEGVFRRPVRLGDKRLWNMSSSIVDGAPVVMTHEATFWDFRRNTFRASEWVVPMPVQLNARSVMWRMADLDGDGRADRVRFVGRQAWWERGVSGTGPSTVYAPAIPLGTALGVCSDLADLDGDGDLDVVTTHLQDGFAWIENVGDQRSPRFGARRVLNDTTGEALHVHVCMNHPCAYDWDHDGWSDIVSGDEDGRVHWFRNTGTRDAAGSPVFEPARTFRQERGDLMQGVLVAPSACDWDGDGDQDFICGDSAGNLTFIENLSGPGVERPSWAEPKCLSCEGAGGIPVEHATNNPVRLMAGLTGSIQGPGERKWGYTSPVVVDWDGDGVLDVVENSVWGYVYWHRNLGTKTAPRLGPATPIEVEWVGAPPVLAWGTNKPKGKELMTQWRTTPLATDWDGDGLPDLVMLDTEGYFVLFRRMTRDGRRVLLPPERIFIDEATGAPIRLNVGKAGQSGRRKICTMDWNGDGKKDFFASSSLYHQYERGVSVDYWRQTRVADGKWYFRNEGRLSTSRLQGHSCAPTPVDFNADGVPDIVVGGEDGCLYYLRNPKSASMR